MNYDISTIMREYDQKRSYAISLSETSKDEIYHNNPKLVEIDREISKLGIEASRCALTSNEEERAKRISVLFEKIDKLKAQKQEIIKNSNIVILPKFECSKCNDTGYINKDGKTVMCSCLKQRIIDEYYSKSNLYRLKTENFSKFNENLYSDKANKEKYGFDKSPRQNINNIKKISMKFVENFDNEDTKDLLFLGTAGTGKTFLSSCIANEIIKKGHTVLYQTAPTLFDSIFNNKFQNNDNAKEIYNDIYNVDLLIIDDLGTEASSSAKFAELFSIINSRLLNPSTKTIISSNTDWVNLNKLYDDRIISRIRGCYDICFFYGDDIRITTKNKTTKKD